MAKLTDRAIKAAGPGRHGDGGGLFLEVSAGGSKTWLLRFQLAGKRRDMGLGSYPEIGLANARALAAEARGMIARSIDPVDARRAARRAAKPIPLFREVAADVIAEEQSKSSNANVRRQWAHRLGEAYCKPLLNRPVNEITATDISRLLKPHWRRVPEASRKLLIALRRVFEVARIRLRDEHNIEFANPALWDDLRAIGFEPPRKLSRGRQPSLPYARMPEFMTALREQTGVAAMMLEFVALTCVRSGAARLARWDEFDLDQSIWTIPLSSLKDRHHRDEPFKVPLSCRAVEILREMLKLRQEGSDIVFPAPRGGQFTDMAMAAVIRRMNALTMRWIDPADGRPITPHGFRSTFRVCGLPPEKWSSMKYGF
jgi:integrase